MEHRSLINQKDAVNHVNFLLNHTSIYPNVAQDSDPEYIDASPVLSLENTHCFLFERGCLIFLEQSVNFYKVDCIFLPRYRGVLAKEASQICLNYMFGAGAKKIIAEVPAFNKPSRTFTVSLGFKHTGTKQRYWLKGGQYYDLLIYELNK